MPERSKAPYRSTSAPRRGGRSVQTVVSLLLAGALGGGVAAGVEVARSDRGPSPEPPPEPATSQSATAFMVGPENVGELNLQFAPMPVPEMHGVGTEWAVEETSPEGCADPQLSWLAASETDAPEGQRLAGQVISAPELGAVDQPIEVEMTVGTVAPDTSVVTQFIEHCDGATWTRANGERAVIAISEVDAPVVNDTEQPWVRAIEVSVTSYPALEDVAPSNPVDQVDPAAPAPEGVDAPAGDEAPVGEDAPQPGEAPGPEPAAQSPVAEQPLGPPMVLRMVLGVSDGIGVVGVLRPTPLIVADIGRELLDQLFIAQMRMAEVVAGK